MDIRYLAFYGNAENFIKEMIESYDRRIYEAVIAQSKSILHIKDLVFNS